MKMEYYIRGVQCRGAEHMLVVAKALPVINPLIHYMSGSHNRDTASIGYLARAENYD
jgi:hypothetical protein